MRSIPFDNSNSQLGEILYHASHLSSLTEFNTTKERTVKTSDTGGLNLLHVSVLRYSSGEVLMRCPAPLVPLNLNFKLISNTCVRFFSFLFWCGLLLIIHSTEFFICIF